MLLKLLVLIAVVVGVWQGFKYLQRLGERRRENAWLAGDAKARPDRAKTAPPKAEDLRPCSVCGAYVPARHPTNCGRPDCPH